MDGWEQYEKQEPFGDECLYLAVLCSWLWNAHFRKQDDKAMEPRDVINYVESLKDGDIPQPRQTTQQAIAAIRSFGMSFIRDVK